MANNGDVRRHQEFSISIVDAFTKEPFAGNPAGVCLLAKESDIPDEIKCKIASEMNLSETAFVFCLTPSDSFEKSQRFGLRWFTPTTEVDLCGHATLATAAVLFRLCGNQHRELRFDTRSGTLIAISKGDCIALDFPQNPSAPLSADELELLQPLIDVSCGSFASENVEEVYLSPTTRKLLVRLKDHISMLELSNSVVLPDHLMAAYCGNKVKGVILTVKGSRENGSIDQQGGVYDFISRYFAPWWGIGEDPVTGSAHTVLGPYWAQKLNKNTLYARQCSKRGGDLLVVLQPNDRIELAGHCRMVVQGKITI